MYKKGTLLVRVKVDDWSSIGIGSIVRLEETAHSRNGNYLVTRLKTVELPGYPAPARVEQRVNLRDFKPIQPFKRKEL